ncbi:MAG: NAD(P)-dependent alcohol dehydrogenase [Thiothrix sp.]|nr:MAG: NAD(P)-dependent alcohol dehydrogenase [Thiothrix sp.]
MATSKNTLAFGAQTAKSPLNPLTIPRRMPLSTDIEMEILYCGICHSDLHQLHNDFGMSTYPLVPGHEIVGRITQIGSEVSRFKVGDLAAIGCIVDSCRVCEHCHEGLEQFCDQMPTFSFNSSDKHLGGMTFGGFAQTYVCDENYVLKMPDNLDLAAAAPLLCAGITVYSPLKHWKIGPDSRVGILGIGGLGHLAIKMAKALGAHVTVFTSSQSKLADAKRLGADEAVLSSDPAAMAKHYRSLNMVLDTVSAKHDINTYLDLLKVDGTLVLVGLPNEPLEVGAFNVVFGRRSFSGSNIGGIAETQEMLAFCAEHQITADIELIQVQEINAALERLEQGDVKYRFVVDMKPLQA